MTNLYTIDHSKVTRYLPNFDPIEQYFCQLPRNDSSRHLIVPQEYLIHFDHFLLPCIIPTQIVKPLTVIKHLVSSPLDDKDTSSYTALAKKLTSIMNFCSLLQKPFLLWIKPNKNILIRIISPLQNLPSNIHKPLVETFLPC